MRTAFSFDVILGRDIKPKYILSAHVSLFLFDLNRNSPRFALLNLCDLHSLYYDELADYIVDHDDQID